jgi:hypothetical protein
MGMTSLGRRRAISDWVPATSVRAFTRFGGDQLGLQSVGNSERGGQLVKADHPPLLDPPNTR